MSFDCPSCGVSNADNIQKCWHCYKPLFKMALCATCQHFNDVTSMCGKHEEPREAARGCDFWES